VLSGFERKFTVYAMDRRGRGGSGDAWSYAIEREFEDIAAVVDAIGEPVNLLGHSFGAVCALGAAHLTSNIGALVLYEPPPVGSENLVSPKMVSRLQALLDHGDREGMVTLFMSEVAAIPPQELAMLKTLPSWNGRVAAAHTILRELGALKTLDPYDPAQLSALAIPVLLLVGGESDPMYADNVGLLHTMLPTSQVVALPGQQHMAMHTNPELFQQEILAFLASVGTDVGDSVIHAA
jgi:pimeloyl-ACP methyl ester carboxylesterase